MMCEGAAEASASSGSVSATFTFSVQGNATWTASSHFFITLGQLGSAGAMEKRERRGYEKRVKCGNLSFNTARSPRKHLRILQSTGYAQQ